MAKPAKIICVLMLLAGSLSLSAQCINMQTLDAAGIKCAVANHEFERLDESSYWYAWKWYENQKEDYGLTGYNRSYAVDNILCTRQTVVTTAGQDYLQSALSMLPPGKSTSIRLGNPRAGGRGAAQTNPSQYASWHLQAEAVSFDITVTPDNALLLFRYAAIMDKPSHPLTGSNTNAAPYLKVGITSRNSGRITDDNLLNKSNGYFCRSGDGDIAGNPEWVRFSRVGFSNCYWKNWTVVGFDLTPYMGQTITLRVENFDCVLASSSNRNFTYCKDHFGYMYFYAECAKKEIEVECLEGRQVKMTAPEGFTYSWYEVGKPSVVLGTGRELVVTSDGRTKYGCKMTQREGMTGSFVLEVQPQCSITKYIYETVCEKDLPRVFNGRKLTESGTYEHKVTLPGGTDSVTYYVLTVQKAANARIESASFCEGTKYTWKGHGARFAALTKPGIYKDTLRYPGGCDSLRCELHLELQEQVKVTETYNLCKEYFEGGNGFKWHGVDVAGFEFDGKKVTAPAAEGCDTLFTLELKTVETVVTHDTVIEEKYGFTWHSYTINETLATLFENTGLSITDGNCKEKIYLHTIIAKKETESVSCCSNQLPLTWHGLNIRGMQDNGKRAVGKDINGKDSVYYYLDLTVKETSSSEIHKTICHGEKFDFGGEKLDKSGVYTRTTTNAAGCDSLITLHLTVTDPPVEVVLDDGFCTGETYHWTGHEKKFPAGLKEKNTYRDTVRYASGCDSAHYTLNLSVYYPSYADLYDEICKGDSVIYFDTVLYTTGTYKRTTLNYAGCDSVISLHLTVHEPSYREETAHVCEGDFFSWEGHGARFAELTPGIYKDTLTNIHGCDSIITLKLLLNEKVRVSKEATLCKGDKLMFADSAIYTGGTYTHTFERSGLCDSVVTLTVKELQPTDSVIKAAICRGGSYPFFGEELKEGGKFQHTLTNAAGCDSVVTLMLTMNEPSYKLIEDTICKGESYTFFGQKLEDRGTYQHTLTNAVGCDSVVTLKLELMPVYNRELTASICEGGVCTLFSDTLLTTANDYTRKYKTVHGCDSVVTVHLTVDSKVVYPLEVSFCKDGSYVFADSVIRDAGTYTHTFERSGLCDSIVTLTVTELQPTDSVIEAAICKGDKYTFFGEELKEGGKYQRTLTNAVGCDSVVTLMLTLKEPSYKLIEDTICEGESYTFFGEKLKERGTYQHKLTNAVGCDSVVTLKLELMPVYNRNLTASICEGGVCGVFSDTLLRTGGNYTRRYKTVHGCDSVVTVHLTVGSKVVYPLEGRFCEGGSYVFADSVIRDAGTYTHTFVRSEECDSMVVLTLTMDSARVYFDTATIYPGQSYTLGERQLSVHGTWRDTVYEDVTHCMSVTSLTLYVVEKDTTIRDTVVLCDGGQYTWEGHKGFESLTTSGLYVDSTLSKVRYELMLIISPRPLDIEDSAVISSEEPYNWRHHAGFENLTQSGTYFDTLKYAYGCDSVRYTLHLKVYSPVVEADVSTDTVCADDPAFALRLKIKGGMPVTCDVLFGEAAHTQSFRDTLGIALKEGAQETLLAIDIPAGIDSAHYVRPDIYDYTVRLTDIFGHEALFAGKLSVLYPAWVLVQRWNDVLMLSNEHYNGGYTFSAVRWYHDGAQIEAHGEHDGYIYQPLAMGEPYWAELTRTDDGHTVRTCVIYPSPQTDETVAADMEVTLAPRSKDNRRISVAANCSGTYIVYDVAGRMLGSGSFGQDYGSPDICLSQATAGGTYLLAFKADDGRTTVRKWIVR